MDGKLRNSQLSYLLTPLPQMAGSTQQSCKVVIINIPFMMWKLSSDRLQYWHEKILKVAGHGNEHL